jgi:hypothetical protein
MDRKKSIDREQEKFLGYLYLRLSEMLRSVNEAGLGASFKGRADPPRLHDPFLSEGLKGARGFSIDKKRAISNR